MRRIALIACLVMAGLSSSADAEEATRTSEIRNRLNNANDWRGHVMVVAHRTGWKENGTYRHPDNSLSGIRYALSLGVEMIEMDIRKSADGVLLLMHDEYLDRTTTCKGQVARYTYAELTSCRLVIDGTRRVTDEGIPRLVDALQATRDQALINVDNKLDPEVMPEIAAEARSLGMTEQILFKQNLWNADRIAMAHRIRSEAGNDVPFMPIFADDAVHDARFMATATQAFSAPAAELVHWHEGGKPMTRDGGPLFSTKARAAAIKGNWHLWINTYPIVNREDGMLAGGRGDGLAAVAPDEVYGFWVDRGATIIQTDEPKFAIDWLQRNGYRIPYGAESANNLAQLGN